MSWLLRCSPAEGTFTAEIGAAGTRADENGVVTLRAGDGVAESVATWAAATGELRLVRDPTGLYPLFWASHGGTIVAGTDARAILAQPGVSREPNRAVVAEWLWGRLTSPEETLYQALRRVPAGTTLVARGTWPPRRERHFTPGPPGSIPDDEVAGRFEAALLDACRRAAPGPSAVFLSGGLDSSAVAVAAAGAARDAGIPPPVALSVVFAGASEEVTQRAVAEGLGLEQRWARAEPRADLVDRALERAGAALWPDEALWEPLFADLVSAARDHGLRTILSGEGGDEALDPGLAAGAGLLRRGRLRALSSLLRAESWYAGAPVLDSLREVVPRALGRHPAPPAPPTWLAPDPELRRQLVDRALPPASFAETRARDFVDPVTAFGWEEVHDLGLRDGVTYRQPLWDPAVLEVALAASPAALVRGGQTKSPAHALIARRLPSLSGRWPRPGTADTLFESGVEDAMRTARQRLGGIRELLSLGVVSEDDAPFTPGREWTMISLVRWLRQPHEGNG